MTLDADMTASAAPPLRPQSLMFSYLGIYVRGRSIAVYSGSIIDIFARVGVSKEAVRSTLSRMARRGLLTRNRVGRRVYIGLTRRADQILEDGYRRMWHTGVVNRDWDGTWTLVSFSLPDSRRDERHGLRSRLLWAGFGPLQNGVWVAPGVNKDVAGIVDELNLHEHVTVLNSAAMEPTEAVDLVHKAFDTEAIAQRYRSFVDRWAVRLPVPDAADDLARQLLLHTEWLQLVRQDPHLPAEHLPQNWPAIKAESLFQRLAYRYEKQAADVAGSITETIATA